MKLIDGIAKIKHMEDPFDLMMDARVKFCTYTDRGYVMPADVIKACQQKSWTLEEAAMAIIALVGRHTMYAGSEMEFQMPEHWEVMQWLQRDLKLNDLTLVYHAKLSKQSRKDDTQLRMNLATGEITLIGDVSLAPALRGAAMEFLWTSKPTVLLH